MNRIVVTSGPEHRDALDGQPLEDSETLRVRWPDGSETEVIIAVETSRSWYCQLDYTTTRSAVAKGCLYRGVVISVPLNGLEAERVDVRARLLEEALARAAEKRRKRAEEGEAP